MSTVPKVNLIVNQGATFRHKFTWQDVKKRAINLTGYSARMQVRGSVADSAILLSLNTTNGGIALGGVTGTISLYLSATATSAINWSKSVYDIELEDASGEVTRLVGGTITTTPEITRQQMTDTIVISTSNETTLVNSVDESTVITEGSQGPVGAQGVAGVRGVDGVAGIQGIAGPHSIAGYGFAIANLNAGDYVEFSGSNWTNSSKLKMTDGGNF